MAENSESENASNKMRINPQALRRAMQNKTARKFKKSVLRKNANLLKGVRRVVIEKSKNVLIVFDRPEIYEMVGTKTYLVFGEFTVEDMAEEARKQAADILKNIDLTKEFNAGEKDAPEEAEVDETGLEGDDIEMVMDQAGVSRAKAAEALLENDKDVVQAIVSLTE